MQLDFLHNHSEFPQLIEIVSSETGIIPQLIEKDYWIMQVLFGLKEQGFIFELKGGTSLSKGFKIIDRFSEDIDIHIKPPPFLNVETNPSKNKSSHKQSRKNYYEWLAQKIKIDGILAIERDTNFDNEQTYNSGGLRLFYPSSMSNVAGVKEGVLLEVGFDTITPNSPMEISSWAFDKAFATNGVNILNNRAIEIPCYHPGYTLVEKLQTITTKFRKEQESGVERPNLMRQYYDVYCLLGNESVIKFIGTQDYLDHKRIRFPVVDFSIPISENKAFKFSDPNQLERFSVRFRNTSALYYNGQPQFELMIERINQFLEIL